MIEQILVTGLASFAGALVGAMIGCRVTWRSHFVTRDEAIEMARVIEAQRVSLEALREMVMNEPLWHVRSSDE